MAWSDVAILAEPEALVVRLHGDIDLSNTSGIANAVTLAQRWRHSTIVFDLSNVAFMDCAGVGALVRAYNAVSPYGCSVVVRKPCDQVRFVLEATGIDQLVHVQS